MKSGTTLRCVADVNSTEWTSRAWRVLIDFTKASIYGHQVWAPYEHFQNILAIRNMPADEELWDIVEFFSNHSDPNLFKERHALSQSEFRKLIQPLVRSGHIVQDFRGGFRSVFLPENIDQAELRREYIRKLIEKFPVITLRQLTQLAGPSSNLKN